MDTIKRILGEDDEEPSSETTQEPSEDAEGEDHGHSDFDPETHEIANLWKTGNRDDVAMRFMAMSNVEAVKLVFAIGKKDALELGAMADQMIEQEEDETPSDEIENEINADSTEPERVEIPDEPTETTDLDYVQGIIGKPK